MRGQARADITALAQSRAVLPRIALARFPGVFAREASPADGLLHSAPCPPQFTQQDARVLDHLRDAVAAGVQSHVAVGVDRVDLASAHAVEQLVDRGPALHAISCAAGYNIRWLMRAIVAQAAKAARAAFFWTSPNRLCTG